MCAGQSPAPQSEHLALAERPQVAPRASSRLRTSTTPQYLITAQDYITDGLEVGIERSPERMAGYDTGYVERETGIEPATSSLGSWRSTAELLPLTNEILRVLRGRLGISTVGSKPAKRLNLES